MTDNLQTKRILSYDDVAPYLPGVSHEPLVDVTTYDASIVARYAKPDMTPLVGDTLYVRDGLAKRLARVQAGLRVRGYGGLKVVYGYRHPDVQKKYFEARRQALHISRPELEDEALDRYTHNFVAVPDIAGHPAGGAVDLTIINRDGSAVDMGTAIADYTDERKIQTYASGLSEVQIMNRTLLHDAMVAEGFAPFYGEWWHFSYGDREWAAFYDKSALYGPIEFTGDRGDAPGAKDSCYNLPKDKETATSMTTVTPRTASGFPEYLPEEQIEFNRLMAIIRETYERYGFAPIDTPDLELSEVLLTKSGGETEQQVYRFTKGSNDLTMRFDLTVPLARYAAQHEGNLVFPFRRYHIGKVHRGERAQAGRFREFYQCDIDVIGSDSPIVDAEFPAVINEIFERFNFGEFTIRLNNRMILSGFFEGIGLADASTQVLRVVDKIEKISREEFINELRGLGLNDEQLRRVAEFTEVSGSNDEVLAQLNDMNLDSETFRLGLEKLQQLISALRIMQVPEHRFAIDLKIARGLDSYTGTVYATTLNDHPEVGSVCSGGRYDNLASHYTDTQLPGVGISIGLSRLFYKLRELGVINAETMSPANIVVMPLGDDQIPSALAAAHTLREAGLSTMFYSEPVAMKKRFRYADKMGFRWVIVLGDREVEAGVVSVKDMQSGESHEVAVGELVAFLASR